MTTRKRSAPAPRATKDSRAEFERFAARLRVFRFRVVAGPPEIGDFQDEVFDPETWDKFFPRKEKRDE